MNDGCPAYLLAGHLGSTLTVTDDASAVVSTRKTWPYGGDRTMAGDQRLTDLWYTGQREEEYDALGLYNYKARFYSTTLGRFVSADPVVPSSDTRGMSRYSYAADNPLRFNDPTGYANAEPQEGGEAVSTCASDPIACLWWSAAGNVLVYFNLVADQFSVSPALLYAIVQNQSVTWKRTLDVLGITFDELQAGVAKGLNVGEMLFEAAKKKVPLAKLVSDVIDVADVVKDWVFEKLGIRLDPSNPSLGIAQIQVSLAQELMGGASEFSAINTLMTDQGGIYLAGAYLSQLKGARALGGIGTQQAQALIAAYRVGATGFFEAESVHGCGWCGPNGSAEVRKVLPLYVDAVRAFGR